ncbi:MAG: recombination mediator RecR [Cyclobacteriaceae bacterium]|nr:recombination mediator RecR [Cyclobacteriaceae bacterium]
MEYPTKLIENAVNEISKLPGIGKKSALRIVLHILKENNEYTESISEAIIKLRQETKYCRICHMISDSEDCTCMTPKRDTSVICVVEDTPDIIAIRSTAQYNGMFHVLGGLISPIDGVGPEDLNIPTLIERIKNSETPVREIVLALSSSMEGDTTAFYIAKKLRPFDLKITTIARGIPVGGELEFTDEITLGRSIVKRINYDLNEG